MKDKKATRRVSTVLLSLLLCIAMLPAGVFADNEGIEQSNDAQTVEMQEQDIEKAEDEAIVDEEESSADIEKELEDASSQEPVETDQNQPKKETDLDLQATTENDAPNADEVAPEDEPVEPGPEVATSFKLNGIQVEFKKPVVKKPDTASKIKPGRVWITGQKASMKVSWINASNLDPVDGVILLRATGTAKESAKKYKEVKRVKFKTENEDGTIDITPKTTTTDTTAKTKDTAYTYRLVSYYKNDENGCTYISPISDWAAGKITTSKLKNVYTGTMNKKTAKIQSKETVQLKLTISNPKTKFMPNSRRWSSSNTDVASVTSGKVTAKAPGTATIRCRLASGKVVTSKITVVGAFKPKAPTIKVDYAKTDRVALVWNKVKYATSYEVYKSNDGLHWDKTPKITKEPKYLYTGLTKGHRYTFYVIAVNTHKGMDKNGKSKTYTAKSTNSNVINQKAVVKLRPTAVTGFPTKKTMKAGSTYKISVKVTYPESRKAYLQMKVNKKWTTKKTITLPKGTGTSKVSITFPKDWWNGTTYWRLYIPKNKTASTYTSKTLTIKSTRYFQNPKDYVQIKNSISKHGYSHYVSPVLVNSASTREDHVNAMIKTAKKYLGNKYAQSKSGAPGKGIDESGLVMQACYGAGVDLWPISPSTRPYNCVPNIMKSKLEKVTPGAIYDKDYVNVYPGDLVFFAREKEAGNTPIHVAIYTGTGGLIHADPIKGVVNTSTIKTLIDPNGKYQYKIVGVRRVFHR